MKQQQALTKKTSRCALALCLRIEDIVLLCFGK